MIEAPEERWRTPHEFCTAEEHEFCSWCAAPADALCHEWHCPACDGPIPWGYVVNRSQDDRPYCSVDCARRMETPDGYRRCPGCDDIVIFADGHRKCACAGYDRSRNG